MAQLKRPLTLFGRILWISGRCFVRNGHSERAVALTYYTVFAIVPVAALLFGIAKGFDLHEKLQETLNIRFAQHKELLAWICRFAETTLKQASGGVIAGVGVIALIWTVLCLAGNIERAFNAVWDLPPRSNLLRRFSDYLTMLLMTPIILVVLSSAGVLLRSLLENAMVQLPTLHGIPVLLMSLGWDIAPLLIACLLFTLFYLAAPNTKVRWLPALLAGIVAGITYQLLQDGFIYLQSAIYRYNRIYGSFAVLPLFLTWLRLSWLIALFGAEISYVAQNIDSGMFDEEGKPQHSLRLRRLNQLAIARLIYSNMEQGRGVTRWLELERELKLPGVELERELQILTAAGVIIKTDGSAATKGYLPLFSPEKFTLRDCIERLECAGEHPVQGEEHLLKPLEQALQSFDEAARQCAQNHLLSKF